MTHFERTYLMQESKNRASLAFVSNDTTTTTHHDFSKALMENSNRAMWQMEYRELDRLSREMEKELQAMKALRMEMEKYKVEFQLKVKDEATQKIKEVMDDLTKALQS